MSVLQNTRLPAPIIAIFAMCASSSMPAVADRPTSTAGTSTRFPPFIADSWAQMPAMVQLAARRASTADSRPSTMARMNSWARCGCDPPWPAPWMKEVCSCCSS